MSNRTDYSTVTFYVELEPDKYREDYLRGVKAIRLTQKTKPLIRKADNKVVKVQLTVPNAQFLSETPLIKIDVPDEAISGYSGEAVEEGA